MKAYFIDKHNLYQMESDGIGSRLKIYETINLEYLEFVVKDKFY